MQNLYQIHQRQSQLQAKHQKQQERLSSMLDSYIAESKLLQEQNIESNDLFIKSKISFSSRWLPGPLSYPWMLMLLGVTEMLKYSFNFS